MSMPQRDRWYRLGLVLPLLVLLIIAGCGPFGGKQTSQQTETVSTTEMPGTGSESSTPVVRVPPATPTIVPSAEDASASEIVEGGLIEPRTLNPILLSDPISEALSHLIFNGLVLVDPVTGEPAGDLAESWEVSDNGLTYTFHLRDSVLWHDGQPFTARDVLFTYNLMMNDKARSPRYSRLVERVRRVSAPDLSTVQFTLIHADASFLTTLATFGIVPEHILAAVLPAEIVTDPFGLSTAVGTGPFTLQRWMRGDRIVFHRNEQYFKGAPRSEQYVYRVLATPEDVLGGLQDGSIDWARLDPSIVQEAQDVDGLRVETLPGYQMSYVALQLDPSKSELFLDDRVRQALMLALDRQHVIADAWHGQAQLADGVLPPASWAEAPSETVYRQNLDEAGRLLDEAGWVPGIDGVRAKDGQRLSFALTTNGDNPERRTAAEMLAASWRSLGIEVTTNFDKWSSVRSGAVRNRDFEAVLLGFRWDLDPDQTAMWSSDSFFDAFNINHYSNTEVDGLLEQALATTDPAERARLYGQVQDLIMRDLPVLPLCFPNATVAISDRLPDMQITSILLRNRATVEQWDPASDT